MIHSRFFKLSIPIIILILVTGAIVWWGLTQKGSDRGREMPPVSVGVVAAQKEDVPIQVMALGTVTSMYTVTVRSRVDGQLDAVHFEEGQVVAQGQLLATLDPRPYQAALTQAEGQLVRDQALLENARLDLIRYRQLLAQNSVSKQQVDTQAALVRQYEGTVKLDQGAVDNAQLQLTYSRITAPISGRVGLRQVDPGNIVQASDTGGLVVITQIAPITVIFSIPEARLDRVLQAVMTGGPLAVDAWDRDNRARLAEGTLLAIDNQLNTSTGTISLKATFSNDDQRLFPNQFVNIRMRLSTHPGAVTLPSAAVQIGSIGRYVYRVNDDQTVSLVKVQTGEENNERTIIEDGVEVGQTVVIDGLDKLRDGARVRVVDHTASHPDPAADKPHKPANR